MQEVDPGKIFGDSLDEDEKYDNEHAAEVVALCADCPISWECLTYAIKNNEQYGIWGGTTPAQRDLMRRRGRR